ncbi:MAG: hypothetical protein RKR03_03435 [Candidatus Competibacter sp.]|nr:hypothetical protein [Candidatus Competibacter sp.]MDS4068542.1 hypothetical protein [Candidatus Competibacter sp.]
MIGIVATLHDPLIVSPGVKNKGRAMKPFFWKEGAPFVNRSALQLTKIW